MSQNLNIIESSSKIRFSILSKRNSISPIILPCISNSESNLCDDKSCNLNADIKNNDDNIYSDIGDIHNVEDDMVMQTTSSLGISSNFPPTISADLISSINSSQTSDKSNNLTDSLNLCVKILKLNRSY